MLIHSAKIYVDDASPQLNAITRINEQDKVHVHLKPRTRYDELTSTIGLYGTVAELRDWIGQLGLVVAEAEHQITSERELMVERMPLSQDGQRVLGEAV